MCRYRVGAMLFWKNATSLFITAICRQGNNHQAWNATCLHRGRRYRWFPRRNRGRFLDNLSFLSDLDIAYLHVFTYSERPNTEAALFEDVVPMTVRNKRSKMLRGLSAKSATRFITANWKQPSILWEGENKKGYIHGFTSNYVKLRKLWNPALVNTLEEVQLTRIDEEGFVEQTKVWFLPEAILCSVCFYEENQQFQG